MKIYIAWKITGDPGYQSKFRRAAAGLRMCGVKMNGGAEDG